MCFTIPQGYLMLIIFVVPNHFYSYHAIKLYYNKESALQVSVHVQYWELKNWASAVY